MSLIRRAHRPGRRTVQANLPSSAKQDEEFLRALWFWLSAGEEAPKEWPHPFLLQQIEALGAHGLDTLIPWLWGAWKVEPARHKAKTFRTPRMLVTDWWAGVKDTTPVDALPPKMKDVANTAKGWHGMFEGPKTGRPLEAWAKKLIPQAFDLVVRWKDGASWQMVKRPVNKAALPQVRVFQEIGHVLAHCYLAHGVIKHYMSDHEMMVLFDRNMDPRCAFAVRLREDDKGTWNWQITEQRGLFNIFPDRRWWPHLASLVGVSPKDFRSMPPGFDKIPPNQGTGEPPRARDPRPDGEDPRALEVWAAGHYRKPLIAKVQQNLDRLRPGALEEAKAAEERRKAWRDKWSWKPTTPRASGADDRWLGDDWQDADWARGIAEDFDVGGYVAPFEGARSWLLAFVMSEQLGMSIWTVIDRHGKAAHAFGVDDYGVGHDEMHAGVADPSEILRAHGGASLRRANRAEIEAYEAWFDVEEEFEALDWLEDNGLLTWP